MYSEKIIQVLAQSHVRFEAALGRTVSLEDAIEIVKKDHARNEKNLREETWVDITTGQTHKANY